MDAAHTTRRPIGRILVEDGLLTSDELETALERHEQTGERLGETIVGCGFVSGPDLTDALAAQYGVELAAETGFGTGLRTLIQHRHDNSRRRERPRRAKRATAVLVEVPVQPDAPTEEQLLLQLEEQWDRLAAAEALLAERERELDDARRAHTRTRAQAVRLAQRARRRSQGERRGGARREIDRLWRDVEELRRVVLGARTRHTHEEA